MGKRAVAGSGRPRFAQRFGRKALVGSGLLATAATMAVLPGGVSGQTTADDSFSCRASVFRLGNFEPYRANHENQPCRADEEGISGRRKARNGVVTEGLLSARTEKGWHNGERVVVSHAEAADVILRSNGDTVLRVQGVRSSAVVACEAGQPGFVSTSRTARVEIGKSELQLGGKPGKLNLGPLGTLHFNRYIATDEGDRHEITRRGVEYDGPGRALDFIVAESRAGYTGNPC